MMRFSPRLKKILLITTIILLGCDVSMLFAAPNNTQNDTGAAQANSPQLQQLQEQVQAQIKALQQSAGNAAGTATTANTAAQASQSNPAQINAGMLPASPVSNQTQQQAQVQTNAAQTDPTNDDDKDAIAPSPFSAENNENVAMPAMPASAVANEAQANSVDQQDEEAVAAQAAGVSPPSASNPAQAAAANQSAAASNVTNDDINSAAFNSMVQNALPMSPDQIQKLRSLYMASQFAASSVPGTPPRPTATSVFVDLSPGATPPVIRLAQGFVTSLVFIDSTGAPWPIEGYDVGNPSAFNIQWDKTSNTLMVQSTVLYTYGNIAVKLRGLNTPVMLTLIPGQKAVDYRVDLRIQGVGPNARALGVSALPASTNTDLLNVLDGVPPANSQVLSVDGGDCQAWLSPDNKMYVRTRLTILSPGWDATLSSGDGMHAYEMQPTPMLLVSQDGQVLQLKVKGF